MKRALNERYCRIFSEISGVSLFTEQPWARSNYWLPALFLPDEAGQKLFLEATNNRGIATRPCWRLIPETAAFRQYPVCGDLSGARSITQRLVNLPGSPWLLENA
jgi:perosamine synthetase